MVYEDGKPVSVDTVVVSTQHDPGVNREKLVSDIIEKVVKPVVTDSWLTPDTKYYVNPKMCIRDRLNPHKSRRNATAL